MDVKRNADTLSALVRKGTLSCAPRGLRNLGNTCFMNAVWQALGGTEDFRRESLVRVAGGEGKSESLLFNGLGELFAMMWRDSVENGLFRGLDPSERAIAAILRANPTGNAAAAAQSYAFNDDEDEEDGSHGSRSNAPPVDPIGLLNLIRKNMPIFADESQHDAHEFLRMFSDGLDSTLMNDLFGGSLLSEVSCVRCKRVMRKVDPCLDISLDIKDEIISVILKEGKAPTVRPSTLHDCFRRFVRVEYLTADDKEHLCKLCPPVSIKTHTDAEQVVSTKQLRLLQLPRILVIHFKRFRWSKYESSTKMARYIQFPLVNLSLKEFRVKDTRGTPVKEGVGSPARTTAATDDVVADEDLYDLVSLVTHHGKNMGNGHYTAFCKNSLDGKWYHFNDHVVTQVDDEVVARAEAYLLFYQKQGPRN